MLFSQALLAIGALSLTPAEAVHQQADIYYHEKKALGASMWHFSGDGLTIYSPDGDVLKKHLKKSLCKEYVDWRGNTNEDCSYFAYASDGHKYVWASSMASDHSVQAFDIDTGDYAGYLHTCSTPLDLEYHPARREMYVRCAQEDTAGGSPGEIDVFSSSTLSADIEMIAFNATRRPYGRIAIHSSMGPYGYSLAYDQNYISEIDLSTKEVSTTYEVPKSYGGYDATYSPINQHLYFRVRVCCTCGSADTDVESCGRGTPKPVLVETGPSASTTEQDGVCSSGCEGSRADTIGVVEFDTVNKEIIANHNIKPGSGFGADPVSSPDGAWVLLLPNDGGQYVRIIKPNSNGESSSLVKDVSVDFTGGTPGRTVISDFAFIQDETRNILVLGASSDNNIVLIDLDSPELATRKLDLAPGVLESTGGSSRKLEWAVGTNYVWVDGGESMEQYIIEITSGIDSARVARTLGGITSGNMIFVNNYERVRAVEMMSSVAASSLTTTASSSLMEQSRSQSDGLAKAGIIVGAIGLVVGIAALVHSMTKSTGSTSSLTIEKVDLEEQSDTKTLGSKQMN